MKITTIGRKVNLRDSFKARIEKKLSKYNKYFGDDADAAVTVTHEKNSYKVEVTIKSRNFIYRVENTSLDIDEALDIAVAKLSGQIRKNKTKLEKRIKEAQNVSFEPVYESAPEEDIEEEEYKVVKTKKVPVKPMDVDEAILQMNLLGHQFFMFINNETDEVNVVYARKDGDYGLLEPNAK